MLLTIILLLLVVLILGLLFIPIALCIDTDTNQYYVKLGALAKASLESHETELIRFQVKVTFFRFYLYPLRAKKDSKVTKKEAKPKKRKEFKTQLGYANKGVRVLRSFKVKQFNMDIDTGDCISNAKLYPVFALLDYKLGGFHINFEGRNRLALHLENRPIYIIKSFINF